MDADGFPIAFDLHPGNRNEQLTLKPLETKVIKDFGCTEFIYCSDSGLGSKNNKFLNSVGNRKYVITQSLKKMKKEDRDIALKPTQYRKIGSDKFIDLTTLDETDPEVFNSVYYKEIPVTVNGIEETVIVTYSPKYKAYQRKIRNRQIDRASNMIGSDGKIKKNRNNPNDPARFIKKTSVTENGEDAESTYCELDEEVIAKEEQYDGFYAVSTNIEGNISKIIAINKRRWQIEECFRILKTEFKSRPVYVSRQDSIKAHFLTCYIALLVYRVMENKLKYKYTINEITETLRNMNVLDIEGHGYVPTYTRTDLTDDLHEMVDFHTDKQIIKKAQMRSIIKQSKDIKKLR